MTASSAPETAPGVAADPWLGCNPLDPAFRSDPYPSLGRLRALDPVNEMPIGIWRLTRYDDCVHLLKEVRCGVRRTDGTLPGVDEAALEIMRLFMLEQDPPSHTRLRRLVSRAFTPRAVERSREGTRRLVERLLDRVAGSGRMDVIADLALPVPSTVICEMLGIPVEDRDRFTVWTAQATHGLAAQIAPPEVVARARAAAVSLGEYFAEQIPRRRADLGDDLLSELIRAEAEGDRLSAPELVSQAIGLLIAGFETTIGLIGNGVHALISHPDELRKLRERPNLLASAVEECLRFAGPIPLTQRILHEETEIGGKRLPSDAVVWAMLIAANRDPDHFPDPDRFDIERSDASHLAFGGGAHFCLGAHLARMEAQIAVGSLVQRFEELALASDSVEWGASLFRVPGTLPITFRPEL